MMRSDIPNNHLLLYFFNMPAEISKISSGVLVNTLKNGEYVTRVTEREKS